MPNQNWAEMLDALGIEVAPNVIEIPQETAKPQAQTAPDCENELDAGAVDDEPIEPESQTSRPAIDPSDPLTAALTYPKAPRDYVEPDWADFPLNIWDGIPDLPGVLLTGPRGTGKTLLAQVYAARRKRPLLTVNCNSGMTADSLLGTPRLDLKGRGGDYMQPGPVAVAAKYNAVLFLDELNRAGPDVQAILNPLADRVNEGVYIPYTGERIDWKQPCILAAMNEGYAGTREVDPALRDRFESVYAEYLPQDDEIKLIRNRTKCPKGVAENAVKTANAIRAAARGDSADSQTMPIDFDLSPRALLSFAYRVVKGQDTSIAWREAVLNRIGNSPRFAPTRSVVAQLSSQIGGFDVAPKGGDAS
jgi:hypothetical protein